MFFNGTKHSNSYQARSDDCATYFLSFALPARLVSTVNFMLNLYITGETALQTKLKYEFIVDCSTCTYETSITTTKSNVIPVDRDYFVSPYSSIIMNERPYQLCSSTDVSFSCRT